MHVKRLIAKAKRKQQNFVVSVAMSTLIGCFTKTFFPLRETSGYLYCLAKAKDSHLRNYVEVHFTELAFEFYCKKEFYVESLDSYSSD